MTPYPVKLFTRYSAQKKVSPIADHLKQGLYPHQSVAYTRNVSGCAAPWISLGVFYHPGAYWIELHVPCRRQKVALIEWEGGESSLPQMAPPSFAKIDPTGVTPMGFSDRSP